MNVTQLIQFLDHCNGDFAIAADYRKMKVKSVPELKTDTPTKSISLELEEDEDSPIIVSEFKAHLIDAVMRFGPPVKGEISLSRVPVDGYPVFLHWKSDSLDPPSGIVATAVEDEFEKVVYLVCLRGLRTS